MENIGYLYILANSSMPGLVKVGKTNRTPSQRAQELACVTGVPTPFIVVFEQLFEDCNSAETFVHTVLAGKGYRIADNREFFSCPVPEVVRAMISAPGAIEGLLPSTEANELATSPPPWSHIFDEAIDHYHGLGEALRNELKAFQLFKQAANLGCPYAFAELGNIIEYGADGIRASIPEATIFYEEGIARGDQFCHYLMALMFARCSNFENYRKCISKFWAAHQCLNEENLPHPRADYALRLKISIPSLLFTLNLKNEPIDASLYNLIKRHREEVLSYAIESLENARSSGLPAGLVSAKAEVVRQIEQVTTPQ